MAVTPNRGYVYPDQNVDNWYNTFAALMNAIDVDIQNFINVNPTSDITIKKSVPAVRFQGQEASAVEFRIVENAGGLYVQKNNGSASAPVWANLIGFTTAGDVTFYVAGAGIAVVTPDGLNTVRVGIDNDGAIKETAYP